MRPREPSPSSWRARFPIGSTPIVGSPRRSSNWLVTALFWSGILIHLAREGGETFTEAEALQILGWLKDQHLLAVDSSRAGTSDRARGEQAWCAAVTWLNPLVIKVPFRGE